MYTDTKIEISGSTQTGGLVHVRVVFPNTTAIQIIGRCGIINRKCKKHKTSHITNEPDDMSTF